MTHSELTISDLLRDPLIRLMLRADRVSLTDFASLLKKAAEERRRRREAAIIFVPH